jgi:uronate dehydrogenase
MTVLITGGAGRIGTALTERLPGLGWAVRPFDLQPTAGGVVGDITSAADLDAAMDGVTAVVHLAGQPTEAPWPVVREANIEGTLQVFEAARRHGAERVVLASSNHAVGFTPITPRLPADTPARPDTLYGVSKVFGEALGRYYADRYGLRVACLRIGTFAPTPPDIRALSTWLSPGDCARLFDACLRSPLLNYAVVWGISANRRRTWTLEEAAALGYRPQDDAEAYADRVPAGEQHPSDAFVGGGFTSPGFGIDEVAERHAADRDRQGGS